jgi:hypothetical protein
MLYPAIEMPNNDQATSSQRTIGACKRCSRNSAIDMAFKSGPEQDSVPCHQPCSTPT